MLWGIQSITTGSGLPKGMICLAFPLREIFMATLPYLLLKNYRDFVTHAMKPVGKMGIRPFRNERLWLNNVRPHPEFRVGLRIAVSRTAPSSSCSMGFTLGTPKLCT